jgi:hypothetical protein
MVARRAADCKRRRALRASRDGAAIGARLDETIAAADIATSRCEE